MSFKEEFILNFIEDNRWRYITNGLGTTLTVTFFAVILGVALGLVIALIRSTADKSGSKSIILKILDWICKLYLTVIRGTPAMIQLLIMYYIVFTSPDISKQFVAIISLALTPQLTWQKFSVPVLCLLIRDSSRLVEVSDSAMHRL